LKRKQITAGRPPAGQDILDETAGLQPEWDSEPGDAAEQGDGITYLDNSAPNGPWKDAYTDFFRRE
jgi:hypothetical protein